MSDTAIVTDSCSCIPPDILRSLNITWIPYYIHRGDEILRDLVSIDARTFYDWLPTAQELPKTASPGPGDYLSTYQELAAQGKQNILSIHMTSHGSGAFQAARAAASMAKELLPKVRIEVVDTLNVAMCTGWIAIEAARAAIQRISFDTIKDAVRRMVPRVEMLQTADTLRYLYMGGRIGRATNLVGTLLNIKPLIGMKEGIIEALGKARSRTRVYERMIELILEGVHPGNRLKVAFMHASAVQEAQRLKDMLESRIELSESFICEFSPALGVHCGPGTAGICYLRGLD